MNSKKTNPSTLPRRDFIALSGLTLATAALFPDAPAMAGPFDAGDFKTLIPPDKKLRPEWVASLTSRGSSTVYSKKRGELRHIGMPVGGLCCGTLYLGGDGKLWLWDIFNANQNGIEPRRVPFNGYGNEITVDPQNGANYVSPAPPRSPLEQGFALKVEEVVRPFDAAHWDEITFVGEYPIGTVTYSDPACPIQTMLTAYSPFIPLDFTDSSLPATICEFTLRNTSDKPVKAQIGGWLENVCSRASARPSDGQRVTTRHEEAGATILFSHFDRATASKAPDARPDAVVENFQRADWGAWKVEGTAFGAGPILRTAVPAYQGDVGGTDKYVVNSHASAPGNDVGVKDSQVGKLTGPPFLIARHYLTFLIGGGHNVDEVGIRLIVDGKTVRRAAGQDNNRMRLEVWDVQEFAGKTARIEIYDEGRGAWGNVGVGSILQTDNPRRDVPLEQARDWGTLALAMLDRGAVNEYTSPYSLFNLFHRESYSGPKPGEPLVYGLICEVELDPGKSHTVTYVVAWHFPNSGLPVPDAHSGNHYGKRFANAREVAAYVAKEHPRLSKATKLWHETWYDSTLPHWFLDRTFVNTSILATSTAHRFQTGRFWGWEGIGCCEGTCTHVWHYAQAPGRIFPELERFTREHVDFGVALDTNSGMINYRGEGTGPAVDGQCGRILGALREHQMSADDAFLRRIWPNVKKAMQFLIHHDANGDGLLDGAQENTLDAAWFGKIAWISSLYAAALRACETMATDMNDSEFARLCKEKCLQTQQALEAQLYNGEYFIQKPEPGRERTLGTYDTCHIDQVHGQSWAWQVGAGRILDKTKTVSALRALYKYNFAPDVGAFRRKNPAGRPYAVAGDGGLIMSTNPKALPDAFGNVKDWQYGYFNECMSGFEHQAASHMIAEGLTQEGLAVTRAIHDRYHASRRNPYNEIECSDHYSRAMASYGSYITACGFTYHGPKGHLGFVPRWQSENFRAAFTAAEGWGTFAQQKQGKNLKAEVTLRHGKLKLNTLSVQGQFSKVTAKHNDKSIPAAIAMQDSKAVVTFASSPVLHAGETLVVALA